ncbi:hypothetical protein [Kitasatospora sp. NPDC008115]
MKRFAKSVTGQFVISTIACAVLFALVWTLLMLFVVMLDDGSPLQS